MSKKETTSSEKRGWVFDQLMIVGQLEAAMGHNDEEICNLYTEMDNNADNPDEIAKITQKLSAIMDIIKSTYPTRVDAQKQIFDVMEGDMHSWCLVKHLATAYVTAGENYHARNCDPDAERVLVKTGEALAMACSLAFGFEPMSCLRCLDETIKGKK